jgi:phosphohistidine phosphatase
MDVYLVRHGEYVDLGSSTIEQDSQNRLSDQGIERLRRQAKTLAGWNPSITRIITSPFIRAKETAEIFGEALQVPVHEHAALARTFFNVDALRQILNAYPPSENLMLVGHESDLSTVASAVIGGGKLELARGGIIRMSVKSVEPLQGSLNWLLPPEIMGA